MSLVDPTDIVIAPNNNADTLWIYEIGMKGNWLDGVLDTKVSLYFLSWDDMQHQVVRVSDACRLFLATLTPLSVKPSIHPSHFFRIDLV